MSAAVDIFTKKPITRRSAKTKPLSAATLADLKRSGLTADDAKIMGIESMTADDCEALLDMPRAGYKLPYSDFDRVPFGFYRYRFTDFTPDQVFGGKIITTKKLKYTQEKGTKVYAYLPACIDWRKILDDPSIDIWVTEGEKKSYAMSKAGFPCVGLGGIWSFHNRLDKGGEDDDQHDDGKKKKKTKAKESDREFLPELKALAGGGRNIIICFDAPSKPETRGAEAALAIKLRMAGGKPRIAVIPPDGDEKVGLDDLLVAKGKKAVAALLANVRDITARDVVAGIRATQKSNAERHRNVAEAIVTELKCGGDLIRTDNSLLYFDSTGKILISLDSEKDRELRAFIDDRTSVTGACPEWNITYERLADSAHTEGKPTQVYKLAHWDAATGTWYRAKSPSKLFRATANGWEVVDNGTDGVLIHTHGQMEDVDVATKKASRAAFDTVSDIPNFVDGHTLTKKQAWLLWRIYIVSLNFPEALPTRRLPLFCGPKGSGKTSGGRGVLRTEYGTRGQVTAIDPKKFDALQAIVINSAITCIDNIDGKHDGLQNLLASVATGGMIELRTLYTTMGKSEYRIDCFLMATSRDPKSFTRDDVADRLLYFQVERREKFLAESELNAMIDANRPRYWRWLLDLMPEIIKALKKAKTGTVHGERMADFAKFAIAVGPVLGYSVCEVTDALASMGAEQLHFQSEHSTALSGIGMYVARLSEKLSQFGDPLWHEVKDHGPITEENYKQQVKDLSTAMTAAKLLADIKSVNEDFPYTNPNSFGQALRNEQTAIESRFKFGITKRKKDDVNLYSIAPLDGYPSWAEHQKALAERETARKGGQK